MKKKYLALVLAGTMALTACGSKNDGQVDEEKGPEEVIEQVDQDGIQEDSWLKSMKTVDLDGNQVDSSMFQEYDLTLVNIWASWCPPCIMEVPELEKLSNKYTNVGVKGLIVEHDSKPRIISGITEENREAVNQIINDSNAHYQHILVWDEALDTSFARVESFPETVFVDSEGNFVGEPIMGAKTESEWSDIIDARLEMVKAENEK